MSGDKPGDNEFSALQLAAAEIIGSAAKYIQLVPQDAKQVVLVPDLVWGSLTPARRKRFRRRLSSQLSLPITDIRVVTEAFGDFRRDLQETLLLKIKSVAADAIGTMLVAGRTRTVETIVIRDASESAVDEESGVIERIVAEVLAVFSLVPGKCTMIFESQDHSFDLEILRTTSILQPVDIRQLQEGLTNLSRRHLDPIALRRALDKLRKKGYIATDSNLRYQTTLSGRRVLPAEKGRNAADVLRALALGRRKWENPEGGGV